MAAKNGRRGAVVASASPDRGGAAAASSSSTETPYPAASAATLEVSPMCLMDGLVIQTVLAAFDDARPLESIWDKHAARIAATRAAPGLAPWLQSTMGVAKRQLGRILPEPRAAAALVERKKP